MSELPTFVTIPAGWFWMGSEGRYDWVDQAVFMDDKNVAKKNQATVGLNAIWVY